MSVGEDYHDRLSRERGWDLARLGDWRLNICALGKGFVETLALAAASIGMTRVVLVGEASERDPLARIAERVMGHLGPAGRYVPVTSRGFLMMRGLLSRRQIWVVDAGDPRNDEVITNQPAYYVAHCAQGGEEFIACGTDRGAAWRYRKAIPLKDRAEIPAVVAHILTDIMARLGVSGELEGVADVCRIPLPQLPKRYDPDPTSILLAGGGGAIAHQTLWAESLDTVLRKVNRRGHVVIVDPKSVHESCRSRQWGYGRDALGEGKAEQTARWLQKLFPGCKVSCHAERLHRRHLEAHKPRAALSSIDTWGGRTVLAQLCLEHGIPLWSAGTSFYGGFARQVWEENPWCASAFEGVERLGDRSEEEGREEEASCSAPETPLPSSVLPQLIVGSWIACQRRSVLLGRAEPRTLARGIEVHLGHGSRHPGYEGRRYSPGRLLNFKNHRGRREVSHGCR